MSRANPDLARLLDGLVDQLAERVADRVTTRLQRQQDQDLWLNLAQAGAYLGVHPDTLRKRAKSGLIPFEQEAHGRRIYFQRSRLDAWRAAGGAAGEVTRIADSAAVRPRRAA